MQGAGDEGGGASALAEPLEGEPLGERFAMQAVMWLVLGVAGLLRRSELAKLRRRDVWYEKSSGSIVVRLKDSKTDTFKLGVEVRVDGGAFGGHLVTLLREHSRWLDELDVGPDAKFLRSWVDPAKKGLADGGEALSKSLRRMVAQTARRHQMDLDSERFSGHSMRRGGAQLLRDRGVPRDLVKAAGRWRSDAVDVYFSTVCRVSLAAVAATFTQAGRLAGWKHAT